MTPAQVDALLGELRLIRQALEKMTQLPAPAPAAQPAPAPSDKVKLTSVTGGQMLGRADAPITMVEYTDLQCPFCRQFSLNTFDQLKTAYIDTGKVRWISRDFPLTTLHPHAMRAAQASRCASDQGKYWELRHALVRNAQQLSPEFIVGLGQSVGLDVGTFNRCIESSRDADRIGKDMQEGQAVGITGTPSFVLGRSVGDGVEGVRLVGALSFAVLEARIKEFLPKN
jgi:protein-disulfide isomerase